jgi:hypothetical protein
MGREVRMVPANWEHPARDPSCDPYRHGGYQPMHDQTFAEAAAEWKASFAKWEAGERPSYYTDDGSGTEFWEYEGEPPNRFYYRPWADDEAVWFQVWETVTEGTPVSPPFATEGELIDYLAANGDFWDQKRCLEPSSVALWNMEFGKSGWGREAAERFVKGKWAPSMVVQDGVVTDGKFAVL